MTDRDYLIEANEFASKYTSCVKVPVGAIYTNGKYKYIACNSGEYNCKENGECYRKTIGREQSCEENRKYCKAIHSEINLIKEIDDDSVYLKENLDLSEGTVYVSRYPCRNCTENLISRGFKRVVYGGEQEVSEEVLEMFKKNNVELIHISDIDYEDHEKNGYEIRN